MIDTATTAEQRIPELRHSGVRVAVELFIAGRGEEARHAFLSSVEMQAQLAGIRVNLTGREER